MNSAFKILLNSLKIFILPEFFIALESEIGYENESHVRALLWSTYYNAIKCWGVVFTCIFAVFLAENLSCELHAFPALLTICPSVFGSAWLIIDSAVSRIHGPRRGFAF